MTESFIYQKGLYLEKRGLKVSMKRSKTDTRMFSDINSQDTSGKKWKKTAKWKDPWRY